MKSLGPVRHNFLTAYRESPSPILSIRFYHTRSFLKLGRDPLPNFSVLWDKTFATKNRDTRSLISNVSWYQQFREKKRRIPIRSSSVLWDKKFFAKSPENTTFLLSMRFFDNKNFLKSGRITLRSFPVLWGNIISTGNCDTPSFLPPRPLIFKKNRPHQNFSKLVKGSFTIFFGTVTKTNWTEHCDTPLLSVTFLDSRKFLKHRRVLLRSLSFLWNKKLFNGKSWLSIPPLIHKNFWYQKFSKIRKGSFSNFFVTVRQNDFDGRSWYPLASL